MSGASSACCCFTASVALLHGADLAAVGFGAAGAGGLVEGAATGGLVEGAAWAEGL